MNFQKLPFIIALNLLIAVTDIVMLSPGLIGAKGGTAIGVGILSFAVFFVGNYLLLTSAYKKPDLKNKKNIDCNDFENAFKGWRGMSTPYNIQIDTALRQLELLTTRQEKLHTLSDNDAFGAAGDEVEAYMFNNFNRIINRLLICDRSDEADVTKGAQYINGLLSENAKCLDVFSDFIDEAAMMLDTPGDAQALAMRTITDSLREIRTEDNT